MRTKLATLEVWTDDAPMDSFSRFNKETRHGTIVVSRKGDPNTGPVNSLDEVKDVLAHELGHFIGYAFDVPEQYFAASPYNQALANVFGLHPDMMKAEEQAWDAAEKMRPVNPATRDKYLDTYRKAM